MPEVSADIILLLARALEIEIIKDKLGLNWAKLSSSWDWALLQLICIILNKTKKMSLARVTAINH